MASYNDDMPHDQPRLDQNGIPLCEPSICIPRVFQNISDRRIFAIFRELRIGFVEKIDMVERTGKDGKEYNMVFVHFRNWFVQDEIADVMRERLLSGEQVKIVYDEPWFWKIHAWKPKQERRQAEGRRVQPFVDFEFREQVKRTRPAPPTRKAPKVAGKDQEFPKANRYAGFVKAVTSDDHEPTPPTQEEKPDALEESE